MCRAALARNPLLRRNAPRSTRASSTRRALGIGRAGLAALLLSSAPWLAASEAQAEVKYTVRWLPSPSQEVVGYLLDVSSSDGQSSMTWDLGQPAAHEGVMSARILVDEGLDQVLTLRAYGGGALSPPSNAIVVPATPGSVPGEDPDPVEEPPPPTTPPPSIPPPPPAGSTAADGAVGVYAAGDALVLMHVDGTTSELARYYLVGLYDIHPTWCDIDDDGDRDLVVGLGPGSWSRMIVLELDDLELVELRVMAGTRADYAAENGETYPACGDVDGDGLTEIAVGHGAGSMARITMLDDARTGFAFMPGTHRRLVHTLPELGSIGFWYSVHGSAKPLLADVDGDGRDELIVSRTGGGDGTISVFDDALASWAVMPALATSEGVLRVVHDLGYRARDGSTDVAAADLDGDGRAEIVVATGRGDTTRIDVFDDAQAGFVRSTTLSSPESLLPPDDAVPLIVLHPGLYDLDGDGRLELSLGFRGGVDGESGEGRLQVLDDVTTGFAPYVWTGENDGVLFNPERIGRVWPAIEANP